MKLAFGRGRSFGSVGSGFQRKCAISVGIELNRSHPFVEKVLKKNKKKSQKLVESDPDLTRIFDEYYKGKNPQLTDFLEDFV